MVEINLVKLRPRNPQSGNAMVLAMIVMTALATLSGLTVVSVQGSLATSGNDQFHAQAVYAAESGGAAAMDFLRKNVSASAGWAAFITPNNASPLSPTAIPGNNIPPGSTGNIFDPSTQLWYSVTIYNNRTDTGFAVGTDNDKRVVVHSTGYGPNGSIATIEWDISATNISGLGRPCPSYGQKDMSEDGAGRNDCLGTINTGDTATFKPGG